MSSEFIDADDDTDALLAGGIPEKHGVRMSWPVRPCSLVGEYVVAVSDGGRDYNPFSLYSPYGSSRRLEGYHSLYVRMARASGGTPDGLLRFCQSFGLPDYPKEQWGVRRWDHYIHGAILYPFSLVQTLADVIAGWGHLLGVAAQGDWQAARERLASLLERTRPLYEPTAWVYGSRGEHPPAIPEFPGPEPYDESDADDTGPEGVWLYWTADRCGDVMWMAREWGIEWDGRGLGDVTREYWEDYSEVVQGEGRPEEPDLDSLVYAFELLRKTPEAAARSAVRDGLSYLRKLGDPDARRHETLQSALIAMLLRDASGGGRFILCRECGMPFYAKDARQRFCPPDPSTGNPKGCAKRKADREAQRRRRRQKPQS